MFRAHSRGFIHAVLAALVLGLPQAALAYDTTDLLGSWRFHSLASGPGEPYWERASARIAGDGSFTAFSRSSDGGTGTPQGTFALGPTGVLTSAGSPAFRGALDIGRTVLVTTDTWDSGAVGTTQMMLGLKSLGAYGVADLAGNWELHSIASGPGAPWWLRGRLAIGANGAFTGTLTELGGTPEPVSGTFGLTSDGTISLSVADLAEGALDAGRTVMALTNTWTGFEAGTTEMNVAVKLAASYTPSDLAGTWEVHTLATGPGAPWWSRGQLTIASNGSFTGSTTRSDGSSGPTSGTITLAADGTLTRNGSAAARGALDAGRSVMVWTDTWSTGNPGTSEIILGVRTGGVTTGATAPAAPALALGPVQPNPVRAGAARLEVRLGGHARALLDVLDIHGRVWHSRDVGVLGAGRHVLSLADGRRLRPGLYWVRLVEGSDVRTNRVVVLE